MAWFMPYAQEATTEKKKINDAEDQDEHREWSSSWFSDTVQYRHSDRQTYVTTARCYAVSGAAQSMPRRLQAHVVDGRTVELDT